jgi:quercetin dioxygenase-like cupin family protein
MSDVDNPTLEEVLDQHIARLDDRELDWDALKFQADYDPKYRRAQMRYMGTGGTGVASDGNVVPANHFTFSTMVLPPGCEGPSHLHSDVEEVFFILKGEVSVYVEHEGQKVERVLQERDLISVPPGLYRGIRNDTDDEALMCVMLGAPKPQTPTYPEGHPLANIKRK